MADQADTVPLSAEDIRRIRKKLNLSVAEAGELLGGGARAFSKYESGTIVPAAPTANLLRVLDAHPEVLATLRGLPTPIETHETSPFVVTAAHVAALTAPSVVVLTQRLLSAEAQHHQLPLDTLHVAVNLTAADDGEDARIEWQGGPERTDFLPRQRCLFQLKATDVSPSAAAKDIVTSEDQITIPIESMLGAGGAYIVLCTRPYTQKQIEQRRKEIHRVLAAHHIEVDLDRIQFRDASQLAQWINAYPAVATWVLELTQPGLVGPFRDWSHWGGDPDIDALPLIDDERLPMLRKTLRAAAVIPKKTTRVVGLAGVGKTRLVYECFKPTDEEEASGAFLHHRLLYTLASETDPQRVLETVRALADSARPAVLIVDRCDRQTHLALSGIVQHARSRLSLITIDHIADPSDSHNPDTAVIGRAPESVIDGILNFRLPKLAYEDRAHLKNLSDLVPRMTLLLADAWPTGDVLARVTDEALINRMVDGVDPAQASLLRCVAERVAVFGDLGFEGEREEELSHAGACGKAIDPTDMRSALQKLIDAGVVQRRGRFVTVQPLPIALALAERQWRAWSSMEWETVLCKGIPSAMRRRAAHQLKLINSRPQGQSIAHKVTRHLCRYEGPFYGFTSMKKPTRMDVLAQLAEIDAGAVLDVIEHNLKDKPTDLIKELVDKPRRALVRALEKISFIPEHFERAAKLLFRLALAENESWSNNATGQFKHLFPVLGATSASAEMRLRFLDGLLTTSEAAQRLLVVEALLEGGRMHSFTRTLGAESHGSRPALKPWIPPSNHDAWKYILDCLMRVRSLAIEDETDSGRRARAGLGHSLRSLVSGGQLAFVEETVKQVHRKHAYWPEGLSALGDVLRFDQGALDEEDRTRVSALVALLEPNGLRSRLQYLVTDMPWDYPEHEPLDFESRSQKQMAAITELTTDLLADEKVLRAALPALSKGGHRKTFELGMEIARQSANPREWKERLMSAYEHAPGKERNSALLTGYLAVLSRSFPDVVEDFKRAALDSPIYAPMLPDLCYAMNISGSDIGLIVTGLQRKVIPIHRLQQWVFGGVLAKVDAPHVAPLFDYLFNADTAAFSIGADLLGMYTFHRKDHLDALRPQLMAMAAMTHVSDFERHNNMDAHHFQEVMTWLLNHGASDSDALEAARRLAQRFVDYEDDYSDKLIRPLLPLLLESFAATVWPIIGRVVATDQNQAWRLEHALGDQYSRHDEKAPPILSLPEHLMFTWCHEYPESAPRFVAALIPILDAESDETKALALHPWARRLIDEFGDREDVLDAFVRNLYTFSWWGSRKPYYQRYLAPFEALREHPKGAVRAWAQQCIARFHRDIDRSDVEDAELWLDR